MIDDLELYKSSHMSNKIRIAYLMDTICSDKAGTEKQLLNIIKRLGIDPILICLHDSPWSYSNPLPCEMISLGYRGFLKPGFMVVLWRYLQCLKERKIEVVQTFFEDAMLVGCLGRVLSRRRHALVVSRRDLGLGIDEPAYHSFFKTIRPYVFKVSDGIAVNAHAIKNQIFEYENVPPEKITVIGNGIDLLLPPRELPSLFSEVKADLWVGIAANLKPVKRIDLLLRALAHLKNNGMSDVVRAVILGDGRLKPELLQLAMELGIDDRVHFIGSVENVSDYLYGIDIGVLCSDKEGLSNAILEYMACGLPVVATDAGGNGELVDGMNGVCVPTGDHLALAQALAKLIESPRLRKELGARSLEKVRQQFTWDKVLPQWDRYYESLAKGLAHGGSTRENAHDET